MIPALAAAAVLVSGPEIPALPPIKRDPQVTYVDRSGQVLGVRGGRYSPPVDIARLPPYVPAAFVSVEDRRFYEHAAVDPLGIARALMTDLTQGRAAQGASTITQQLARNLFLNNDKTMERKATEVVYAMELEQKFTKQQILGLYLSRVYFGSGVYGIEDAAERFFNKPASRLTLKEAAILAGVVRSPAFYDPAQQPVHAQERAGVVLAAMEQTRAINGAQRAAAMAEQPRIYAEAPNAPAQYFLDWVDGQTRRVVGTPRQDITVETTLDKPMELDAGRAAADVLVAAIPARGSSQAAVVSGGRPGPGARPDRRHRLCRQPLRPRRRRPPPGRIELEAVRLSGRARGRPHAGHGGGRRAGADRRLVAARLRGRLPRPHHPAAGPGAVDQHRRRAPGRRGWPRRGGRDGPSAGDRLSRSTPTRRWP